MKRIIISSALPLSKSGYGNQTLYMVYGLIQKGYTIPAIICWNVNSTNIIKDVNNPYKFKNILNIFFPNEKGDAILKIRDYIPDISDEHIEIFSNINIYPVLSENWREGNYKITDPFYFNLISLKENSNVMLFHQDFFCFKLNSKFNFTSVIFTPLHYYPLDNPNKEALKHFDIYISLSDFGYKLLKSNFPEKKVTKIPLCVDIDLCNYDNNIEKKDYKKMLGFHENHFVCSMIANNEEYTDRKGFQQNLQAFSKLHKKYKNCRLYIHTRVTQRIPILNLLRKYNIKSKIYKYCDQDKYNNHLYNRKDIFNILKASDVLLHASKSEGFGIPIIEAQACRCSVVTTNFSAMPELTVNGISTDYKKREKYPDDKKSYWAIPDIDNIYKALETIYNWNPKYREEMISKGIEFSKRFSISNITQKIVDLCDSIENKNNSNPKTLFPNLGNHSTNIKNLLDSISNK